MTITVETVCQRLWEILDRNPDTVTVPLWIQGPYWNSSDWENEPVIDSVSLFDDENASLSELDEIASSMQVYAADWAMGVTGGSSRMDAYDLGDDFVCLVQFEDAGDSYSWIVGIVPSENQDDEYGKLQLKWIAEHDGLGINSYPTDISGIDFTNPAMLRALASRLQSDEATTGYAAAVKQQALVESLGEVEFGSPIYGAKLSHEEYLQRLHAYWNAVVESNEGSEPSDVPPGLDAPVTHDTGFAAWLGTTRLRWRDTGDDLSPEIANALRLSCQYVAKVS